jgi:pimeloyl-ACP methyl ester carboxylesterase
MLDVAENTRTKGIEFTANNSSIGNFPSPAQREVPPEHIEEVRKAVAASEPEGYARTCEMIMDLDHKDPDYSKVTCPAVFVAGDLDMISPVQRSKDVSRLIAGPNWVEIVESGHQPLISASEPTIAAVQKLLAKI